MAGGRRIEAEPELSRLRKPVGARSSPRKRGLHAAAHRVQREAGLGRLVALAPHLAARCSNSTPLKPFSCMACCPHRTRPVCTRAAPEHPVLQPPSCSLPAS